MSNCLQDQKIYIQMEYRTNNIIWNKYYCIKDDVFFKKILYLDTLNDADQAIQSFYLRDLKIQATSFTSELLWSRSDERSA